MKKKTARIDLEGLNEKINTSATFGIPEIRPVILDRCISHESWTTFCNEVKIAMRPLEETEYAKLCPLLCIPVIGCFLIGTVVENIFQEKRNMISGDLMDICKETSNAQVTFYVRKEEIIQSDKIKPVSVIFIEAIVLE
mmetsp:Transcript_15164/g.17953  ORF Transcript_15164/g.17953 Transcript_15164/m.17953 type:complete len:139 (+) Transcript_15164:68-484(+)